MLKGLTRFNGKGVENNGSGSMEIKYKNTLGNNITSQQAQKKDAYYKEYSEFGGIKKEERYTFGEIDFVKFYGETNQTDETIIQIIIEMYNNIDDTEFVLDIVRRESWGGYSVEHNTKYTHILTSKFKRMKTRELIDNKGRVLCMQSIHPETEEILLTDEESNITYPRSSKMFYMGDSKMAICYLYYNADGSFDHAELSESYEDNIDSGTERDLSELKETIGIPDDWMAYYSTAVFYPGHGINTI